MTNPAYNPQAPQSEQKLRIYSYYLEVYSGVLLQQRHVPKIHVYDLMAGKGTYNGNDGSAMHALKICEKLRQAYGKAIHLYLNEKDPEHYRELCENINPTDSNWVTCENEDVNDAVKQYCLKDRGIYKLFFLDPFGYTQVSKESIDLIASERKSECLLFVPVADIFRFASSNAPAKFFRKFGIDADQYKNAHVSKWVNIIRDALKKTYSKQFVGACHLDAGHNAYALYFLGNHIYGLDKFLGAAQSDKNKNLQLTLFSSSDAEILSYLSEGRTNKELYEWVIREKNWSLPKTREILKEMESREQILVEKTPHAPGRRKGNFYLSYKYFNDPVKITVKSLHHGD